MTIAAAATPRVVSRPRVVAFYRPGGSRRAAADGSEDRVARGWSRIRQAQPNFVGHYQPHLPAELEPYAEGDPNVRGVQAALAQSYGIDAFCYLCEWAGAPAAPAVEIDAIRHSSPAAFPFCVCWENGSVDPVAEVARQKDLVRREYSPDESLSFMRALVPAFADPRYLRVDGRPLFVLCDATAIHDLARVVPAWRSESIRAGQGNPYLVCFGGVRGPPPGFDAAIELPPSGFPPESDRDRLTITNPAFEGEVRAYRSLVAQLLARVRPSYKLFRTAIPGWDDTPRDQHQGVSFTGSTPEVFGYWVEQIAQETRLRLAGEERLLFIRSWNEWDAGCHVEPDQRYGRQYLAALRDALERASAGVPERPAWPIRSASSRWHDPRGRAQVIRSRAEQPVSSEGALVSVVMPAYNHERFVGQALDSVLGQTHANLEVIVIDDGSRDATGDVLDEYAKRCTTHPLTVVHQQNSGTPDAINHGLSLARGDVIALMNSDDLYAPTRLARLLSAMRQGNARFAFSATSFVDEAGATIGADDRYVAELREGIARAARAPDPVYALVTSNIAISSGNFVFQRQLLDATGGFCAMRVCHDWDFILAASYHTPLVFLNEPLYVYRLHAANTFADRGLTTRLEIEQLLAGFFRDIERHPLLRATASRGPFIGYLRGRGLAGFLPSRLAVRR